MKSFAFIACLIIYFSSIDATSYSDQNIVWRCDTTSSLWGCDPRFWTAGNRLRCQNTSNVMNWATKPSRSSCYTVTAGDEANPTALYTPGDYINIHIRVRCLD